MKRKKLFVFFIFIIIIVLIFIVIINIPNKKSNLNSLGYNSTEISEINKLTQQEKDIILKYDYIENLVDIIKNEKYNKNNLDKYIRVLNETNNIDIAIDYVNNYMKENDNIDQTTLSLINEKYFVSDFLDRYINYYNNNNHLELNEVIKRVNSNLDYTFYEDSKPADLSKGMYTLVNKFYYLDKNYIPDNLETVSGKYARDSAKLVNVAKEAFIKMADDARNEGLTIKVTTAYRSYDFQSTLYNNYVKADGVNEADTYSARPGYSEHQLGYSVDLTNSKNVGFEEFDKTKEYEWLQNNAYKYGFIQRYPKDKEYITGYVYESWHYRFVGIDIAKFIYENNLTYEEYYAYYLR